MTRGQTHEYLDRATDYDRIFYIYYLGCFNNTPIYHYGESSDIHHAELKIKKTVPFYERVWYTPLDNNVYMKDEFDEYIKNKKIKIMLPDVNQWDAFTTDEIDIVIKYLSTPLAK